MRAARWLDALMRAAGLTAIVLLVAEYGWGLSGRARDLVHLGDFLVVAVFLVEALLRLLVVRDPVKHVRQHAARYFLVAWLILELPPLLNLGLPSGVAGGAAVLAGKVYLALAQVYLVLEGLVSVGRLHGRAARLRVPRFWLGPGPFLLLIILGTAALAMPRCQVAPWHPVDLLFTATSAVCVTGLATRDIASGLTPFGHGVLLALIQVGGLGVMTVTAYLASLQGELRGKGHALMMAQLVGEANLARARALLARVVAVTVACELAGAWLLHMLNPEWPWFAAVFHAVSAFCNAGFSTFAGGLETFRGEAAVLLPVAALIIAGGLGFIVLPVLGGFTLRTALGSPGPRLPAGTRRTVAVTGLLVALGWLGFQQLDLPGSGVDHLFQSVTTRTAGFSSVPQTALAGWTLAGTIALMVIGAGSLSTGGGIKVTTFALLLEWPWRRASRASAARRVATELAFAVAGLYALTAATGTLALMWLSNLPAREALFLSVSALSTVGLDRGITAALSVPGKVAVMALMVGGRVALLSLVLARVAPRVRERHGWAQPDVMVG